MRKDHRACSGRSSLSYPQRIFRIFMIGFRRGPQIPQLASGGQGYTSAQHHAPDLYRNSGVSQNPLALREHWQNYTGLYGEYEEYC